MLINIIANFLTKFFDILLLGWLNKLVGSLLGFIKGIFIVCIIIFVLQIAPQTIIQKLESDSILYQICNNVRINLISSMYLNHDSNPIIKSINNTIENNLNKN